jgi:hypothetical protein
MLLDSATLGIILNICYAMWIPHSILLSTATFLRGVSHLLMGQIFTIVVNVLITTILNTGLPQTLMAIALLLAGVGLIVAYTDIIRVSSLPKVLMYGVFAAALFAGGPTTLTAIDSLRTSIASLIYSTVYNNVSGAVSGLPGAGTSEDWATFPGVQDHYGDGITAHDIAMSALWLSDYDEFSPLPPQGFVEQFFPDGTDLSTVTNSTQRQDAIRRGTYGVLRLLMAYPLSIAAVQESMVLLVFSVAAFLLLASLPFAILFSFFLQTENIPMGILRQYLNLVVSYLVVNTILAVIVSVMMSAAGTGNAIVSAASGLASIFVYKFAWEVAVNSAKPSFTALTGAIAQQVGAKEPIGELIGSIRGAAGNAVGVAGAGLAVAAGMPLLAPSLFGMGKSAIEGEGEQSQDSNKGSLLRMGMGFLGGKMMQGTGIGDVATTLAAMSSFGGARGLAGMAEQIAPEDAILAGLQSGSNPVAMMMALDRSSMRRERMSRRYAGGGGDDAGAAPIPPGQSASAELPTRPIRPSPAVFYDLPASPWRADIEQAVERLGVEWAKTVVDAIAGVSDRMKERGLTPEQIAVNFVGPDGRPSMQSNGGRLVFDALPEETKRSLLDHEAREGVVGVVGQMVMPRLTIRQDVLMEAIVEARAQTENDTSLRPGDGVKLVADKLGLQPQAMGSAMGMIDAMVRETDLAPEQIQAMLPAELPVIPTTLKSNDVLMEAMVRETDLAPEQIQAMLPAELSVIPTTLKKGNGG